MKTCRVMTYNIRHGQGMDNRLDLSRTARVIVDEKPDLLAVQEVDRRTARVGGMDELTGLAECTGMHSAFSKSIDYQGGAYGNAVFSRFPILAQFQVPLSGTEPRSALVCEVQAEACALRFVCTHLDLDEKARVESVAVLDAFLAQSPVLPTVLCGDFNGQPTGPAVRRLREAGWREAAGDQSSPTYPAGEPAIRIDYVLGRWLPHGAGLSQARVVAEPVASDHRPVVACLSLV